MAASPHLSGKIRETLGDDAGQELIGIVDKAASDISELRADVAELRHEMQVGFARIEQAMLAMRSDLKLDLTEQLSGVRDGLAGKIAAVQTDVANVKADLMKWSFVFLVGAVAAIALLAGVLRT